MIIRTRNTLVVFHHPLELKGVDRTLPPGEYRVMTDEQFIDELSFPVYCRVSTVIFAPGQSPHGSSVEMLTIDPRDLQGGAGSRQHDAASLAFVKRMGSLIRHSPRSEFGPGDAVA